MQLLRALAVLSVLLIFFGLTNFTVEAFGFVKSNSISTQKIAQLTKPAVQPGKPTLTSFGQSDLIIENLWWEPANPLPGQAITYYARVKNTGSDRPYANMGGRPFYGFNTAFAFLARIPNPLPSGYYGEYR
ncbi:MAG: hypothetical protein HY917_04460, partial [Candidatus Diapherotrites archaeon]|nr:hypothetical protein [Candidatus Diapherotrites archaeon]